MVFHCALDKRRLLQTRGRAVSCRPLLYAYKNLSAIDSMSATAAEKRELAIFIATPIVMLAIILALYLSLVPWANDDLSKTGLAYTAGITTIFAVLLALNAPFQKSISERLALTALILCGAVALALFATIYYQHGLARGNSDCKVTFDTALYFSIVTFTTLGYGDFQPAVELRLLASFEALFGYVFLGFSVAIANDAMNKRGRNYVWDVQIIAVFLAKMAKAAGSPWQIIKRRFQEFRKRLRQK